MHEVITSRERLFRLLDQARIEQWEQLALFTVGNRDLHTLPNSALVLPSCQFGEEERRAVLRLPTLRELSLVGLRLDAHFAEAIATYYPALISLDLGGNGVGAEGALAVAALTNLTSLDLGSNGVGAEGALALAALTNLTSLDLGSNGIGAEGARALAALTNLTSLDLGGNGVGAEGARALAALTNLTSLDLGSNGVGAEGARALAALTNLTSLDLGGNGIGAEGARALAALTNLTSLDLSFNALGAEGALAVAALTNLISLDLSFNDLGDEGAQALAALTNLISLDLGGNGIGAEGARALAALTNLISLDLGRNEIGAVGAQAVAALTNLISLDLGRNEIGAVGAQALAALTNLTSLDLSFNDLGDEGAQALAGLSNLTWLDLSSNKIGDEGARVLLDALSSLNRAHPLWRLLLNDNPIRILPKEALNSENGAEILAAYQAYKNARAKDLLRPVNEAKLLVLGAEAVGKTSIVKFLIHDQPRDPNEKKTPGIKKHERIETTRWAPGGREVALNVWDFGGQEMMRGTHRYFLTARSLYMLVLENRREDDVKEVHEWLKVIRNLGKDAPVLVVVSKCDEDRDYVRQDDEKGLKAEFPNIVDFIRVSCNDDEHSRGQIAELGQKIARIVSNGDMLPHVQDPMPTSWLRVKKEIAAMAAKRSTLKHDAYVDICLNAEESDEQVTKPTEQRSLLRLLADLGAVVAHGLEMDSSMIKREITLLDPNWLTEAIYPVLDAARDPDRGGIFAKAQLPEWLDSLKYPPDTYDFILEMMQEPEIGLFVRIPGPEERYLVPQALPNEPLYTGKWPDNALHVQFHYDFLPRSVFPRFLVDAHRHLTAPPVRWLTGALFEIEQCRVLVTADRVHDLINIMIDGEVANARAALAVISTYLGTVHDLNPEINPQKRLPLPSDPGISISYDHLVRLEGDERYGPNYEYLPEGAKKPVIVGELLGKIGRDRPRHKPLPASPVPIPQPQPQPQPQLASDSATPKSGRGITWLQAALLFGLGAVILSFILAPTSLFSDTGSRVLVSIAAGFVVAFVVMMFNPISWYRRMFVVALAALTAHAGGGVNHGRRTGRRHLRVHQNRRGTEHGVPDRSRRAGGGTAACGRVPTSLCARYAVLEMNAIRRAVQIINRANKRFTNPHFSPNQVHRPKESAKYL